jgi:hypothetical protein
MLRLPTAQSAGAASIRIINQPQPLHVNADDGGLPRAIVRQDTQRVAAIQDVWRIDDEWWRDSHQPPLLPGRPRKRRNPHHLSRPHQR